MHIVRTSLFSTSSAAMWSTGASSWPSLGASALGSALGSAKPKRNISMQLMNDVLPKGASGQCKHPMHGRRRWWAQLAAAAATWGRAQGIHSTHSVLITFITVLN